jgi:hypothetical protein
VDAVKAFGGEERGQIGYFLNRKRFWNKKTRAATIESINRRPIR